MLKPNSNFKLHKSSKRILSTILDPHKYGDIKRSMIQAQLYGAVQYKPVKGKKEDN